MRIAVTGSAGLIGSRFVELMKRKFEISKLDRTVGIDITDRESVLNALENIKPLFILHFAAKTHVDECEKDKQSDSGKLRKYGVLSGRDIDFNKINFQDWKNKNSAFAVNVVGTKNVAEYALSSNIRFIYISTDFVFDGEKDYYAELDNPNPINWYGQTKYWGEILTALKLKTYLIVRLAYPYGGRHSKRLDFARRLVELISSGSKVNLVYDHIMTPTFIDDIVHGIEVLISKNSEGIYHLVGESFISPYEAGLLIAKIFSLNADSIGKISRAEFFSGRAKRPFKLRLKNDKLEQLGFKTRTFEEGLEEIKSS